MIIMDVIYGAVLSVAWLPAIFSVMLSDGGTSLSIHLAIYGLATFPFVLGFSLVVPWIFYALRMPRTANALLFLPLVNAFIILVYVVLPEVLA
jgi:hypothetical protein